MIELKETNLIFADPVMTPFGSMRFLTYREYMENQQALSIISQNVLHLYYIFRKSIPPHDKEALKEFKSFKERDDLHNIVFDNGELRNAYIKILYLMMDKNETINNADDMLAILTDIFENKSAFLDIRDLIMRMHLLKEEKVSPNLRLQEIFERDKKIKAEQEDNSPTHMDILASIADRGFTFEQLSEETPFQIHMRFAKIAAVEDYRRNVLFATVSNEVTIESWAKKIDLFEVKDTSISKAEFAQKSEGMFK